MSNTPAAEGNQPSPPKSLYEGSQNAVWYGGRYLDPVRNAALHEAVRWAAWIGDTMEPEEQVAIGQILDTAERFERWLTGTDEATP